jgi:hypothetical protein
MGKTMRVRELDCWRSDPTSGLSMSDVRARDSQTMKTKYFPRAGKDDRRSHRRTLAQSVAETTMNHRTPGSPLADGDGQPVLVQLLGEPFARASQRLVSGLRALGEFAGATKPVRKGAGRQAVPVHESITLACGYLDWLQTPPAPEEIARSKGKISEAARTCLLALNAIQQRLVPTLLEALRNQPLALYDIIRNSLAVQARANHRRRTMWQ